MPDARSQGIIVFNELKTGHFVKNVTPFIKATIYLNES